MNEVQVSVIIPAFNRARCLPAALDSVLAQQNVSYEVIVVDDGSTDGTAELVRERFPGVRLISRENGGPAAARNTGLTAARGRWIAFLDSDDTWLPGKLEAQIDYFRRNPEMRIMQTEEIWIRNGKRVNPMKKHRKSGGWIFEKCLPLCLISPSAVMMERSLLEEEDGFDESYPACEDYELWLRITSRLPAGYIEKPFIVKYGGHADQRSREFPAMDRFRIRALEKILASGRLSETQREAAAAMLTEKAHIYAQGAMKRGNLEEAERMAALSAKY